LQVGGFTICAVGGQRRLIRFWGRKSRSLGKTKCTFPT